MTVYGSDLVVELLRAVGIRHVALNPGATFRGLHAELTLKDRATVEATAVTAATGSALTSCSTSTPAPSIAAMLNCGNSSSPGNGTCAGTHGSSSAASCAGVSGIW